MVWKWWEKKIKLFSATGRFSTSGWRPWEWCFRWGHHSYYLCISKSRHQGEPEITDSRSSPGVDGGEGHGGKGQPTCYSKNLPNYRMTSFTNAFSSQWVFESWGIGFRKWHKFPFFLPNHLEILLTWQMYSLKVTLWIERQMKTRHSEWNRLQCETVVCLSQILPINLICGVTFTDSVCVRRWKMCCEQTSVQISACHINVVYCFTLGLKGLKRSARAF